MACVGMKLPCGTKDTMCNTDATPHPYWGVFDRHHAANSFKSYTVVNVLSCSGDIHGEEVITLLKKTIEKASQNILSTKNLNDTSFES